jgi:hypothetical protein
LDPTSGKMEYKYGTLCFFVTEGAKKISAVVLLFTVFFLAVADFGGMKLPSRDPFYLMLQAPSLFLL